MRKALFCRRWQLGKEENLTVPRELCTSIRVVLLLLLSPAKRDEEIGHYFVLEQKRFE